MGQISDISINTADLTTEMVAIGYSNVSTLIVMDNPQLKVIHPS